MAKEHFTGKLDLTGQRFGKLTVLAPAERIGHYTAWLCRCECGREAVVATRRLRNGGTRSCGCLKPDGIPHPTYIDGTSPEMLTAAKVARKNNTSGVPGVARACGGLPSASKASGTIWAATANLRTPSRPGNGRRKISTTDFSRKLPRRQRDNSVCPPRRPHQRGRPVCINVGAEL